MSVEMLQAWWALNARIYLKSAKGAFILVGTQLLAVS